MSVNGLTSSAMVAIHDICLANGAQIPVNPVDPGINQTWEPLKEWKPKVTNPLLQNWDHPEWSRHRHCIVLDGASRAQAKNFPCSTSHCMSDARVKVPMFKYLAREFILGLPTISSSTSSESGEQLGHQSVVRWPHPSPSTPASSGSTLDGRRPTDHLNLITPQLLKTPRVSRRPVTSMSRQNSGTKRNAYPMAQMQALLRER
jgi:hypothetical protein